MEEHSMGMSDQLHDPAALPSGKEPFEPSPRLIKHQTMCISRGVEVYFHKSWPQHSMEKSGQLHYPAALTSRKEPFEPSPCLIKHQAM
jgi:hypothetical protein